jgi:DinB family protein
MQKTLLALLLLTASAFAQTKDPISSGLRDIFPNRQKNIIGAVDLMPANKFDYKPTPDQMTFGHLVTHIIESNYNFCSKAAAVPAPPLKEVKETDTKERLAGALKTSFDFCSGALEKMDDSKLGESTDFFGKQVTRGFVALVLSSSWADHYGAAAMYLRLNGLTPPSAKK